MAICTSVEKVRTDINGDLLKVVVDNLTTAYWFYDYADALQFVGQEVIVDYRMDMLDGNMQQFIKTFVRPKVITTLEKQDNFKLYLDQQDNNATVSFAEIGVGDTAYACCVFCSKCEIKSSQNATWLELLIRDKFMRVAKLRLFNYDAKEDYTGTYICCDLERNQYGFKTSQIIPAGGDVMVNEEIVIAKKFIENFFATDAIALDYIAKTGLFNYLEEHVDYEKGYGFVRLAAELSVADALKNVTKDIDVTALCQAILCRYGYLTKPASVLSPYYNNLSLAQKFMFPNRRCVVCCLDDLSAEELAERTVLNNVVQTVDSILKIRKGVTF